MVKNVGFSPQSGERSITSLWPKDFHRSLFFNRDKSLFITNKRVIYQENGERREINFADIYDIRVQGKNLNIYKRGDSLDYDYDRNFETYEMDRPYITITGLKMLQTLLNLINDLRK